MPGKITPKMVSMYARECGVASTLKAKSHTLKHEAAALMATEERSCKPKLFNLYEYFHMPKDYRGKKYLYISELISLEYGGGTNAVQKAVKESIKQGNEGRVALHATMIDPDKGHPFLFYYKLGFRSIHEWRNKMAERILKNGNNHEQKLNIFSDENDFMYLPKENIRHCLQYIPSLQKLTHHIRRTFRKVNIAAIRNYRKITKPHNQKSSKIAKNSCKLRIHVETELIDRFNPWFMYRRNLPKEYLDSPVTHISILELYEKGAGTKAIKEIVRKSLNDKSEGRVVLLACLLDFKKGHPMGFYYKLGFRSISEKYNKICEEWLKNGGKMEDRPWKIKYGFFAPEQMYLPKENIKHCLNYPEKI